MYSKCVQPKLILIGQIVEIGWKMANGQLLLCTLYTVQY